jgi:vacuolar-type H+-ATPase subunit F/Vma7
MARVVYIGDETTAAGFRLAGVETRVTEAAGAADALRQALTTDDAECVLLTGEFVASVPAPLLQQALEAVEPLFAVVPDVRGAGAPPDLVREVRNALGIEA